jgi:hypothetical protein
MWLWEEEAQRGSDPELDSDVRRLRSWFREVRGRSFPPGAILGYGRGWTPFSSKPYPLVLFNWDLEFDWQYRFHGYWRRSSYWRNRLLPIDQLLSADQRQAFSLPETKSILFGLAVHQPQPSLSITEAFQSLRPIHDGLLCPMTQKMGSPGVTVELSDGSPGVLTAGHVVPCGEGSEVESVTGFSFWKTTKPFGRVEHRSVPIGTTAGWDAAVIRPNTPPPPRQPVKTRWPSVRYGQELTYARGARSGFVDTAVLIAGLEEVESSPLSWSCCWLLGPPTALKAGDSGASVFVRKTGELLGTYLGVSRLGEGAPYAAYVQDAYSLQENLLTRWKVSF